MSVSVLSENLSHRLAVLSAYVQNRKHSPQLLIIPAPVDPDPYVAYGDLTLVVQTDDHKLVRAKVRSFIGESFTPLCVDFYMFKDLVDTYTERLELSSGAFVWDSLPYMSSTPKLWGIQHDVPEQTEKSNRKLIIEVMAEKHNFYERPKDKDSEMLHSYAGSPAHDKPICAIRVSALKAIWPLIKPYVYKPASFCHHAHVDPKIAYRRVQFSSGSEKILNQMVISASNTFAITEQYIPLGSTLGPFEFAIDPGDIPGLIKGSKQDLECRILTFYAEGESMWIELSDLGVEVQVALLPYQDYERISRIDSTNLTFTLTSEQSTALYAAIKQFETQKDIIQVTWTSEGLSAQTPGIDTAILHSAIRVPELGDLSIPFTPSLLRNALAGLTDNVFVRIRRLNKEYKLQFVSSKRQDTLLSQEIKKINGQDKTALDDKFIQLSSQIENLEGLASLLDRRNRQNDYQYFGLWFETDRRVFTKLAAEARMLLQEIESSIFKTETH